MIAPLCCQVVHPQITVHSELHWGGDVRFSKTLHSLKQRGVWQSAMVQTITMSVLTKDYSTLLCNQYVGCTLEQMLLGIRPLRLSFESYVEAEHNNDTPMFHADNCRVHGDKSVLSITEHLAWSAKSPGLNLTKSRCHFFPITLWQYGKASLKKTTTTPPHTQTQHLSCMMTDLTRVKKKKKTPCNSALVYVLFNCFTCWSK